MTRLFAALVAAHLVLPATPVQADPPAAAVTGVALRSENGRAEMTISVQGAVQVQDRVLSAPDRLVLDVAGARLASTAAQPYDGQPRGGVKNVRTSQFKADVVRIVLDLDAAREYKVAQEDGAVRVSFKASEAFTTWASGTTAEPTLRAMAAPRIATPRTVVERVPAEEIGDATAAVRPAAAVMADALAPEPKITVTFDKATIADVVAGFAAFSGRTIILGKDIKGEVSAEIKNQPWPSAFNAILAAQGLSAQEMPGGIIRVDNPSVLAAIDSLEPVTTKIIPINYAQAGQLVKTVESTLSKNRGRVVADSSSNSLIITDVRSRLEAVEQLITGKLDARTRQVSIQAKIIFVDRTSLEQLGLRYDIGTANQYFNRIIQRPNDPSQPIGPNNQPQLPGSYVVNLGGNQVSAVANANQPVLPTALDVIFSTAIGGYSVSAFLSALSSIELSDVQAEPVITTLDNRKADILVGEEAPVRVIDASSATGAGQPPRATVQFRETGIRLTVTPHVTDGDRILLDLQTERSAIQLLSQSDLGFLINKQRAQNQLLVGDGETAVIGGLTVTEVRKTRSGIPILSKLPGLGKLFSFSSNSETRRDLLILVTPRIVDDGSVSQ